MNNRSYGWRSKVARLALMLGLSLFCAGVCPFTQAAETAKTAMPQGDLVFLPAFQMAEMIRTGKITSSEAVEAYLAQIEKHNRKLNAIVMLDVAGARKRAREADEAFKRGEIWGPLHGVPVTIKDNYATAGLKTTSSIPSLADYVPKSDATVVRRIKKAGAVILGKTHLPPMGLDVQSRSPLFGVTNNPWDINRTVGGSSGGEGAAVAAGFSALGMGNDIGGSIRIPSHFCGIYGIKPTENFVSSFGNAPGLSMGGARSVRHMICNGPMARSIEDLKLAMTIIAGPDQRLPDVPEVDLRPVKPRPLSELRITWMDDFGGVPVTVETKEALKAFMDKLSARGCKVEKYSGSVFEPYRKNLQEAMDLYKLREADFSEADYQTVWTTYGELMDLEVGASQPSVFRLLNYLGGSGYRRGVPMISMVFPQSYEKYLRVMTRRDFIVAAMDDFMLSRDVLICPVTSTPAFNHMKPRRLLFDIFALYEEPVMVDDIPVKYLVTNTSYTSVFNLTGSPVVVMPVGYTKSGLPIGVQIVGKRWRDMELLGIAGELDKAAGQYRRPPGY